MLEHRPISTLSFACALPLTACLVDDDRAIASSAQEVSLPGGTCVDHGDCDSAPGAGDGVCYRDTMGVLVFAPEGYCTIDDGTGAVCATDADCPAPSQCVGIDGYLVCLPRCGDGAACPPNQGCFTTWNGYPLDKPACLPGDATASDGDACVGFYQCNTGSTCWNDLENPGGNCSAYGCDLTTGAGCHGGTCIVFEDGPSPGTVCVVPCVTDDDCRAAEGYVCHDPGYCRHPHVGDPCTHDAQCGGAAWSCLVPGFPDGYCTITACPTVASTAGCSSGSICAAVDGANTCVDRCPVIGSSETCRPGYLCTAIAGSEEGGCLPAPSAKGNRSVSR